MTSNQSEELKHILPMMRRGTSKALDEQMQFGTAISKVDEGRIINWWHKPSVQGSAPVLFELHGGGFALGDVRKGDALRSWMSYRYGVHTVGVGYRLAPENPWPAALNDVVDTIKYFADHTNEYNMDAQNFYLIGYSAGANLALATCFKLQEEESLPFNIRGLALHYPFLDAATDPASLPSRSEDLPVEMMTAFNSWYAVDNDPANPLISPLFATDAQLSKLPFVTQYPAVGDALFGSSEQLNDRLVGIQAPCAFHPVSGVYHGYIEDAANIEVYKSTNLPETIAARSSEFPQVAARALQESLDEILGNVVNDVPFDPENAINNAQHFSAQEKEVAGEPLE